MSDFTRFLYSFLGFMSVFSQQISNVTSLFVSRLIG